MSCPVCKHQHWSWTYVTDDIVHDIYECTRVECKCDAEKFVAAKTEKKETEKKETQSTTTLNLLQLNRPQLHLKECSSKATSETLRRAARVLLSRCV